MISTCFISIIVGIVCVVIGVLNTKGNVSTLHTYNKHHIAKHNIKSFSKFMGAGNITIGASALVFGVLSGINIFVLKYVILIVGASIMFTGLIAGLLLCSYAAIKYNKGKF